MAMGFSRPAFRLGHDNHRAWDPDNSGVRSLAGWMKGGLVCAIAADKEPLGDGCGHLLWVTP